MRGLRLASALALLAAAAAAEPAPHAALEKKMAERVNAARAEHKLPPLTYHDGCAGVARGHSRDMAENHFFGHESPTTGKVGDRLERAGVPHRASGENVAGAKTLAIAHRNLMASPPHRKNILNRDFTHIGVGIVGTPGKGLLVTQVFIKGVPVYDAEELTEQVIADLNAARKKKGLRRLVPDKGLMQAALAHCRHAEKINKPDPMWLEDRIARAGDPWRIRDAAYYFTDDVDEVLKCPSAMSPRYEFIGLGIVQTSPRGPHRGALWVTVICAQR